MSAAPLIVHANGICTWECNHAPVDRDEVTQCRAWFRAFASPRRTLNTRAGSYWLKHLCEEVLGTYVSNGALIQAAMLEGYDVRPIGRGNPNAFFNVSVRRAA